MIKTTALGLATLAAIAAPSASAYTINQHGVGFFDSSDLSYSPVHAALVDRLNDHGVVVVDGSTLDGACDAEPGYKLYGFYSAARNFMAICPGLTDREWLETLTHEAVHAFQDYRVGLQNDRMGEADNVRSVFAKLPAGKQAAVLDYPAAHQALEAEAWFYETRPAAVLEAWSF